MQRSKGRPYSMSSSALERRWEGIVKLSAFAV
jgi:hypothetical protein